MPSPFILWKAPQWLFTVAEHVRGQPGRVRSRLMDLRAYRPRRLVEAIKIAVTTVPDHALARAQAQQPLIELLAVGFFGLGRGAVGPQGVLPALQVGPKHVADSLSNVLNLRYCDVAVVLFPGHADSKRLFQVVL